jgi:hypothetical protein
MFSRLFKRYLSRERRDRFVITLVSALVPLLHRTWRVTLKNEPAMQTVVQEQGAVILVTWHGRMLVPTACSQNRGYHALVSRSNDGAMLCAIFERLGWHLIRGSTGRNAIEALRQGRRVLSQPGAVLAFTPDGPRGPSRVAKSGMIYYAQKTGKPIMPVGVSAWPRCLLKSWDRFMVPLPFARCVWIYGDPIYVTEGEDSDALTRRVEAAINALEKQADACLGLTEAQTVDTQSAPNRPASPYTEVE